jgi:hypothetical protein
VCAPASGPLVLPDPDASEPAKRSWLRQLDHHGQAARPTCDVICRVLDAEGRPVSTASFLWNGSGYDYTYEEAASTTVASFSLVLFDAQLPGAARALEVTAPGYEPLRIELDPLEPSRLAIIELHSA